MSVLSLPEDEEDEDCEDDCAVTEYVDDDSDNDPDYYPDDGSSDGSVSSMSSVSVHSPVAKRRRLNSMPRDDVLHFLTSKSRLDLDICRRWVSLLSQLLPGLGGISEQYLGTKVGRGVVLDTMY